MRIRTECVASLGTTTAFCLNAGHSERVRITSSVHRADQCDSDDYPYHCIRIFQFVSQKTSGSSVYPSVIEASKPTSLTWCMSFPLYASILTLFPVETMYGISLMIDNLVITSLACDLRDVYTDLSYRPYKDTLESNPVRFFISDILSVLTSPDIPAMARKTMLQSIKSLNMLRDRVDHLYAGALFHPFDEET
jgi:hypothetical protein